MKSKVYKLIDAMVEDMKNQGDVQESMKRWWRLIHPADRPIARKYLLSVLQKSNATLEAITDGLVVFQSSRAESIPSPLSRSGRRPRRKSLPPCKLALYQKKISGLDCP